MAKKRKTAGQAGFETHASYPTVHIQFVDVKMNLDTLAEKSFGNLQDVTQKIFSCRSQDLEVVLRCVA